MFVFMLAVNGSSHGGSEVNMALATCDTYARPAVFKSV